MALVNVWTASLIFAISLARTGMGIYTSISGPTLLYLADKVDASVYKVSTMFTGRSIGSLLGAVLGGIIKSVVGPRFRHLLTLGAGMGILGISYLAILWISDFWLLIVDFTVSGIMFGYLDAGLQALILQLWGEKASRAQIQLFHMTYSIGAFVAPFIASPFLAMADQDGSTKNTCPGSGSNATTPAYHNITVTTAATPADFNPTGWVYVIAASWMIFVSALLIFLSLMNIEARVSSSVTDSGYSSESRKEEPIGNLIWFFLLVIGYYFCSVTTENVYYNYIYSISLCSDLHFTVTQASHVTSIFWLGFGLGRTTGVVGANFVKPRTFIVLSIIGSIADMAFLVVFGEHSAWLLWLLSASHGYTTAMLYPSGVSWVSQITNMSGTYMFVFNIGNAFGSLSMTLLAGYLFDLNPFNVMYLVLGLSVANAFFFAMLSHTAKKRLRHQSRRKNRDKSFSEESSDLLTGADSLSDPLLGSDSNLIQEEE